MQRHPHDHTLPLFSLEKPLMKRVQPAGFNRKVTWPAQAVGAVFPGAAEPCTRLNDGLSDVAAGSRRVRASSHWTRHQPYAVRPLQWRFDPCLAPTSLSSAPRSTSARIAAVSIWDPPRYAW